VTLTDAHLALLVNGQVEPLYLNAALRWTALLVTQLLIVLLLLLIAKHVA
jgi:uncharacterized integral membrane protein